MQSDLRLEYEDLASMFEFIDGGGRFNEESLRQHNPHRTSLIAIARVPVEWTGPRLYSEGGYYHFIRDGLHRCCIAHLCRGELFEDEYIVEDHNLDDFKGINLECGWVTPFDPIREVRLPDFHTYKQRVLAMIAGHAAPNLITDFINECHDQYATQRRVASLEDIAHDLWVYGGLQDEYGFK
jgi:hypothetical protein